MGARHGRRLAAAAVVTLLITSCTGGTADPPADPTSSTSSETTTSTADPSPPTTQGPTTSTSPPGTTTTLPPPPLPDPFELAEAALRDIPGFTYVEDTISQHMLNELEFRLGGLLGDVIADYSWSRMDSEDGDELIVLAMYPANGFRGDPELDFGAAITATDFADPTPVVVGTHTGWRIQAADSTWTFVGDNTHVFLAIGDDPAASQVLEALLGANGPAYLWAAGDCLYFEDAAVPYAPFGDANVVTCDDTHTHEVIWSFASDEGPDARYPGDDLADSSFAECEVAYEQYVGIAEFPSRVAMVRYLPDVEEWAEGDRYLACVVYEADRVGDPIARQGVLEGIGDAALVEVTAGDCWDIIGGAAVRCGRPHRFEYLGRQSLAIDGADYPGVAAAERAAAAACDEALGEAVSDRTRDGATLEAFAAWFPGPAAWARGDRETHCVVSAFDRADGPVLIMGSIGDSWEPVVPPVDGGFNA